MISEVEKGINEQFVYIDKIGGLMNDPCLVVRYAYKCDMCGVLAPYAATKNVAQTVATYEGWYRFLNVDIGESYHFWLCPRCHQKRN